MERTLEECDMALAELVFGVNPHHGGESKVSKKWCQMPRSQVGLPFIHADCMHCAVVAKQLLLLLPQHLCKSCASCLDL